MYYISLLKNKCVEYKKQIIFCLCMLLIGVIVGIICNSNIKDYEIVMIKSNIFIYYLRFSLLFLFIYFLILFSVIHRYFNILTPIAIILLGYFLGRYIYLTFTYNTKYCFLSIILFFNLLFINCFIFIVLLVCSLKEYYYSCCFIYYLIKDCICFFAIYYLLFLFITFLIFFIFSNFTNTIIIV